ncbi:MAG: HAD family phosphatase [Candidatus Acidiferrales bacterium]
MAPGFELARGAYDALLFDCDGTLVHTAELHHFALAAAMKKLGHQFARDWYQERVGLSLIQVLAEFNQRNEARLTPQDISPLEEEVFCGNAAMIREVAAVATIVRGNVGRIAMAVVSSSTRRMVQASLEAVQLASYFSTMVTVEDVPNPKPAPDGFLEAARRLSVAPDRCLVFEDSEQGLEAARRAGMHALDVRSL